MTTNYNLDLSNVVSVAVLSAPSGASMPNVNTAALFSAETPLNSIGDYAIYKSPSDVEDDFGTNSKAYKIANAFFSQPINPLSVGGYLAIAPLLANVTAFASKTIQDLTYTAVTGGTVGNDITIAYTTGGTQGSEVVTVSSKAISVQIESGKSTAEDIKAKIDDSSAASALVTLIIASGKGTHAQTGAVTATNLTGGAAAAQEKVQAAIARVSQLVYFFGVLVDQDLSSGTDFVDLTDAMQALDKMLFFGSSTAGDIATTTGIFWVNTNSSNTHSRCIYYTLGAAYIIAAAYAGRALSTNFSGSNTCQTMHLKKLATIGVDTGMTQTTLTQCQSVGADVYCSIAGVPVTFTSGANGFFDEVYNELWFKLAIQIAGFNVLEGTNYKVPQTENGIAMLKNGYMAVCAQAVANGFLAPGSWTSPDSFGSREALIRNVGDYGYYIYSQPVSQQLTVDRAARKAPVIQIAAKASGAVHSSSIIVNINS